jgi:peptide/nickel transport system permease protein
MERHHHPAAAAAGKAVRYLIVFFVIISLNFLLPRLMPGDPVMNILGEEAFYGSPQVLEDLKAEWGLDGPLHAQYLRYLGNYLKGDWGQSFLSARPVLEAIGLHLRWTLALVLPAVILGALLAAFAGALAAWYRKSPVDIGLSSVFLSFYSMPHYWLAMVLLFVFGFLLGWFPLGKVTTGDTSGMAYVLDVGWHMVLPLSLLTISKAAYDFLVVRNSVISIYGEDYVLMAQAKGLSQMAVLFKHTLRNALAPLVTVTAIQFGAVLSGTLMVEIVFSWPGMGTLIYEAIGARDYPLLQGAFFIIAICMLAANFIADLVYVWLDPRTR